MQSANGRGVVRRPLRARCSRAMVDSAALLRRMGGGVARGGGWSSITWCLGRSAEAIQFRTFGCVVERITSTMRGSASEPLT